MTPTAVIQYTASAVCLALIVIAWTRFDGWAAAVLSLIGTGIALAATRLPRNDNPTDPRHRKERP
jgi:hypothetical protein